jgi:hypothetical protein
MVESPGDDHVMAGRIDGTALGYHQKDTNSPISWSATPRRRR